MELAAPGVGGGGGGAVSVANSYMLNLHKMMGIREVGPRARVRGMQWFTRYPDHTRRGLVEHGVSIRQVAGGATGARADADGVRYVGRVGLC